MPIIILRDKKTYIIDHSVHQTDLPLDKQVLNISVNLARIAYWTADSLDRKKQLNS